MRRREPVENWKIVLVKLLVALALTWIAGYLSRRPYRRH